MRIGINVPNELLHRVKRIYPEVNVSQVCREALEYLANLAERTAAQAASDGVDYHVERLDKAVPKPLVEPDWVAYALRDARDWVRNIRTEGWERFIVQLDALRKQGRDGLDMVDIWSQSSSVYADGVKGLRDRLKENEEWFIEQYEAEAMTGISSHIDLHQKAIEQYGRAWLGYISEVKRLLKKRRKEEYDQLMAERADRRRSLPKPELPARIEDVQQAILNLSKADYTRLGHWLNELDWEKWDRQIEADSAAGKLDFLAAEATEADQQDTLEPL